MQQSASSPACHGHDRPEGAAIWRNRTRNRCRVINHRDAEYMIRLMPGTNVNLGTEPQKGTPTDLPSPLNCARRELIGAVGHQIIWVHRRAVTGMFSAGPARLGCEPSRRTCSIMLRRLGLRCLGYSLRQTPHRSPEKRYVRVGFIERPCYPRAVDRRRPRFAAGRVAGRRKQEEEASGRAPGVHAIGRSPPTHRPQRPAHIVPRCVFPPCSKTIRTARRAGLR
jgi:hypothetical protein